jgi:hypothetical protein
MSMSGLNVIRSVASTLRLPWPCRLSIGYGIGTENPNLPGQLVYRDIHNKAGFRLGYALGYAAVKLWRKIIW